MQARRYQQLAQEWIRDNGHPELKVDGYFGPKSEVAGRRTFGLDIARKRMVALAIQQKWNDKNPEQHHIEEDAWWGPDSRAAADAMLGISPERPDERGEKPLSVCHDGTCSAVRCWSPSDREMIRHYGQPGTGLVTVELPYPVRLDWNLAQIATRTTVHRDAASSFQGALEEARDHYGIGEIRRLGLDRFGGVYNKRRKRGGTTWSTHAFGAAADWFPSRNLLGSDHHRALFARADYAAWFAAWERAGWMSLGRCFDFDWMHVQLNPS